MDSVLETAIAAAHAAGAIMSASIGDLNELTIEQKSLHDFVSEVDRNCEKEIRQIVAREFPEDDFVGEEYGVQRVAGAKQVWIVDPLDGTTNYLRGIPHYAVSIARASRHGESLRIDYAVVYDPAKQELFHAQRGQGAWLNGKPIKVHPRSDFAGALLATGVPFSGQNLDELNAFSGTMTDLLAQQTSGIRRLGSAALDLAYVAAGRYDGYWEANLNIWDIAAGALLVTEAGGLVSDFHRSGEWIASGDIVAASSAVHPVLVAAAAGNYQRPAVTS